LHFATARRFAIVLAFPKIAGEVADAMLITPESALSKIEELGFPPLFLQIHANEIPDSLFGLCQCPQRFYKSLAESIHSFPRIEHCVPLWEVNREYVWALDIENGEYLEYYYGDSYCTVLGETYQQFVTAFFINLVYAGVDDLLDGLSTMFCYRHLLELKEWAAIPNDDEPRLAFVSTIKD
jgi:hypothetical protein